MYLYQPLALAPWQRHRSTAWHTARSQLCRNDCKNAAIDRLRLPNQNPSRLAAAVSCESRAVGTGSDTAVRRMHRCRQKQLSGQASRYRAIRGRKHGRRAHLELQYLLFRQQRVLSILGYAIVSLPLLLPAHTCQQPHLLLVVNVVPTVRSPKGCGRGRGGSVAANVVASFIGNWRRHLVQIGLAGDRVDACRRGA